jgi:hypothetical protein
MAVAYQAETLPKYDTSLIAPRTWDILPHMNVTDALVNTGQFGMVTGFQNGRLPNRLGPCWKTEGGFGFSFQISFNLNDVDPAAIKVVRKTCFQTLYRDPTGLKQAEKDILTEGLSSGATDSTKYPNMTGCGKTGAPMLSS